MSKLPTLNWHQVVIALEKTGFIFHRQKGSHLAYYHPKTNRTVIIPKHRELKKGTLREILREADLSREEFIKLLK